MNNAIIVESNNDKAFLKALIKNINLNETMVDTPICLDDECFKYLEGKDINPDKPTLLIRKFKDLKSDIPKVGIKSIGILVDIDNDSFSNRFLRINNALKIVFQNGKTIPTINEHNKFYEIEFGSDKFKIAVHFTNVEEKGDLETLLKKIKNQKSEHADCLESWRSCLKSKKIEITDKEFDKFWVSNYLRFDTASKKERAQANKYCNIEKLETIIEDKPGIFNLESPLLNDLKEFLKLFK